jgi:tetratricopeptide (TPR) repeat protein
LSGGLPAAMAEHVGTFGGATPAKGGARLDYYAIVAGAIAALHEPSAEARQAVYDHARRVVLRQLHTPPGRLSKDQIAKERRALERAIQVVERKSQKHAGASATADAAGTSTRKPAARWGAGHAVLSSVIFPAVRFAARGGLRASEAMRASRAALASAPVFAGRVVARLKPGSSPKPNTTPAQPRFRIEMAALRSAPTRVRRALAQAKPKRAIPAIPSLSRVRPAQMAVWSVAALVIVGLGATIWLARARLHDHSLRESQPQLAEATPASAPGLAAERGSQAPVAFGPPPGCNAIMAATDLAACASAARERQQAGVDGQPDPGKWLTALSGVPQPAAAAPATEAAASPPPSPAEPVAGPTARARDLTDEGKRLAKDGDLEQAMRVLTDAVRTDPLYADGYVHRGQTYFKLGDTEHALMDLNEAIRLDARNAPAWRARGMAQLYKGDEESALADLSKAIQLTEADPTRMPAVDLFYAHRIRAGLCDKRKLYDREIYDLSAMIDAYWKDPLLAEALRTSYREAGVATLIGSIYRLRANAHVRKGAPDLAISDLSFAIQLDPQKALPLLLERARLQDTLNRREQALADYQRVLELTPANEEAKAAVTRFKGQALN